VTPIKNKIENAEANVIIRAVGATGIIIHAEGVKAVSRSEAVGDDARAGY
jgi:hypothetical protein